MEKQNHIRLSYIEAISVTYIHLLHWTGLTEFTDVTLMSEDTY